MLYKITLTIKKTGSDLSRDYDLTGMTEEQIGKKVKDMQNTLENAVETKF